MIETREKTIGNSLYSVTQLPARRALKLKAHLFKIFGASLAQFLMTEDDEKKNTKEKQESENEIDDRAVIQCRIEDIRRSSIVRSIQLLSQSIDDKSFDELCVTLLQGVRRDGAELTSAKIDLDFAGKLCELYSVIAFVLEVNFGDFFLKGATGNQSEVTAPEILDSMKHAFTFRSEKSI